MKQGGLTLLIVLWLAAIGASLIGLFQYATKPSDSGAPNRDVPKNSNIAHADDSPTVIQFVHPHCPCSKSSLAELEEV